MKRDLGQVAIVITGASSGIGRAASLAFARQGCRVVLAARSAELLDEIVAECEQAGGAALAIPTDTTDLAAVRELAERAAEFGGGKISVWVNNAGVAAFGLFLDVPVEAHEQVLRTNLIGYLYGAHAALPLFERQGSGVLINVVSLAGLVPTPLAASYSASKFGNRGLFDAVRSEFAGSGKDIHVCDLHPAFVDTPFLEHTANYEGRAINPVPPVIAVERVADEIVAIARRPRPSTSLGALAPVATFFHTALPGLYRWSVGKSARAYLTLAPGAPRTEGGLNGPSPGSHDLHGNLRSPRARLVGGVLAAGALLGAARLIRGRGRD